MSFSFLCWLACAASVVATDFKEEVKFTLDQKQVKENGGAAAMRDLWKSGAKLLKTQANKVLKTGDRLVITLDFGDKGLNIIDNVGGDESIEFEVLGKPIANLNQKVLDYEWDYQRLIKKNNVMNNPYKSQGVLYKVNLEGGGTGSSAVAELFFGGPTRENVDFTKKEFTTCRIQLRITVPAGVTWTPTQYELKAEARDIKVVDCDAGVMNDPHIKTWGGDWFDFHGT